MITLPPEKEDLRTSASGAFALFAAEKHTA
jgi:hypothetical protein